ncbi:sucrase ferredoxin [Pseudonocardia nantongensis]|uniref:sucrase ferredoxin n=1 Tax=Pseudonocardia nantongensis TaxID=1181885 RepID=UPI00397E76A5
MRERLGAEHPVRVWRISSFGGHRFAPVAIDLPEGRFWGRLTPDVAVQLADHSGDPAEIIHHYRGWSLLDTTAAQIVEHQLLTEQGWSWIGRPTHATVHEHDDRDTVRIDDGTGPDDLPPSAWEASVEAATTDEVLVGCVGPFGAIQRYRITDLTRPEQAPAARQKARA